MKGTFSFPREARDTSQALEDAQIRLEYLEAVLRWGLDGRDPPNAMIKAMLIPLQKSLDKKALANLKRSEKMKGNSNAKKQTKQCKTDKNSQGKPPETKQIKQCKIDKNSDEKVGGNSDLTAFGKTEGIYNINNNILYNLIKIFTQEKINNYKQIYTLSQKTGEEKYFYAQYLEAEKIVKKIGFETFEIILKFCLVSEFWKHQILSIAKLNKKNKDGAYYYDVMIDKIREWKPPAQTIYSADLV